MDSVISISPSCQKCLPSPQMASQAWGPQQKPKERRKEKLNFILLLSSIGFQCQPNECIANNPQRHFRSIEIRFRHGKTFFLGAEGKILCNGSLKLPNPLVFQLGDKMTAVRLDNLTSQEKTSSTLRK